MPPEPPWMRHGEIGSGKHLLTIHSFGSEGWKPVSDDSSKIPKGDDQTPGPVLPPRPETPIPPNSDSPSAISLVAKDCLRRFQNICNLLQNPLSKDGQDGYDRDLALLTIQDARARFKAWGNSIAAFQDGAIRTSLDFRLREASGIRGRALQILEYLQEYLHEATLIISGEKSNEAFAMSDSSDESDDSEQEIEGRDGKEQKERQEQSDQRTELQELFSAINASNGSLMKLSMVIRSSPARDDYIKAASRYKDWNPYPDIGHVKEKHGSAKRSTEWLLQRLGKGITRRRQFLKYRVDHFEKLSGGWDEGEKVEKEDEKPEKTIASTKATTFLGNDNIYQREGSDTAGSFGSQTSYEATVLGDENMASRLTVPPPPKFAFPSIPFEYGEPFNCPYCYIEQNVKNKAAWKKHVFRDLKPYICTFKECDMMMFRSRNEWFSHELQNHRREWVCQYCQHGAFQTSAAFSKHIKSSHPAVLASTQLEALILQSEEAVDTISAFACPLCDEWEMNITARQTKQDSKIKMLNDGELVKAYGTRKQFRGHLGRHMEQLALFALPMNDVDELDNESTEEDEDDDSGHAPETHVEPLQGTIETQSAEQPRVAASGDVESDSDGSEEEPIEEDLEADEYFPDSPTLDQPYPAPEASSQRDSDDGEMTDAEIEEKIAQARAELKRKAEESQAKIDDLNREKAEQDAKGKAIAVPEHSESLDTSEPMAANSSAEPEKHLLTVSSDAAATIHEAAKQYEATQAQLEEKAGSGKGPDPENNNEQRGIPNLQGEGERRGVSPSIPSNPFATLPIERERRRSYYEDDEDLDIRIRRGRVSPEPIRPYNDDRDDRARYDGRRNDEFVNRDIGIEVIPPTKRTPAVERRSSNDELRRESRDDAYEDHLPIRRGRDTGDNLYLDRGSSDRSRRVSPLRIAEREVVFENRPIRQRERSPSPVYIRRDAEYSRGPSAPLHVIEREVVYENDPDRRRGRSQSPVYIERERRPRVTFSPPVRSRGPSPPTVPRERHSTTYPATSKGLEKRQRELEKDTLKLTAEDYELETTELELQIKKAKLELQSLKLEKEREQKEKLIEEEKRIKKELELRKLIEEREEAEKEKLRRHEAKVEIEIYKAKEAQRVAKEKKEKEEREEEYRRRLEEDLRKSGMDEGQIGAVMKKDKPIDPNRPTYTRMSRRHLSIETLNTYRIDYEIDADPDYVLIKRWVPEHEQDILWNHTREIREKRPANPLTFKIEGKNRQTREPEFEWVRKKERRPKKASPSPLLQYLAGARGNEGEGSGSQP